MDIFRSCDIPVPKGGVATTSQEALKVYYDTIGERKDAVIKAQVLSCGRKLGHFSNGFKGGVHFCYSPKDIR